MISNANLTREEGVEHADYQEGQQHGTARSGAQRPLTELDLVLVCTHRAPAECTDGGVHRALGRYLACTATGRDLVCTDAQSSRRWSTQEQCTTTAN